MRAGSWRYGDHGRGDCPSHGQGTVRPGSSVQSMIQRGPAGIPSGLRRDRPESAREHMEHPLGRVPASRRSSALSCWSMPQPWSASTGPRCAITMPPRGGGEPVAGPVQLDGRNLPADQGSRDTPAASPGQPRDNRYRPGANATGPTIVGQVVGRAGVRSTCCIQGGSEAQP